MDNLNESSSSSSSSSDSTSSSTSSSDSSSSSSSNDGSSSPSTTLDVEMLDVTPNTGQQLPSQPYFRSPSSVQARLHGGIDMMRARGTAIGNRYNTYIKSMKKTTSLNSQNAGTTKRGGRSTRGKRAPVRAHSLQPRMRDLYEPKLSQPLKIGPLKLVLKRENNNYKIQSNTVRPMREAAQRVKFVFSDDEQEMSTNKKPNRMPQAVLNRNSGVTMQTQKMQPVDQQKSKATEAQAHLERFQRFSIDDLVHYTHQEKLNILTRQPNVLVNHSKPFPIALVEEGTNIVHTKALLINHLFQSYTSPCILCPLCKKFLNVYEFTRHLHEFESAATADPLSDDDEYNDYQTYIDSILSRKKLNILPYQTANNPLTAVDMDIWKSFARHYMLFKQDRLHKRDKQKQSNRVIQQAKCLSKMKKSKTMLATRDEFVFNELNNWDYVTKSKNVYILNRIRLDTENCIIVENQTAPMEVFNEKKEELVLSEDENDDDDEQNRTKKSYFTKLPATLPPRLPMPSIQTRYFNLYDNLSFEILLYMCDNSYTIIPNSYIEYINSKREKLYESVKSSFIKL